MHSQCLQLHSAFPSEDGDKLINSNTGRALTFLHMMVRDSLGLIPETIPMHNVRHVLNVHSQGGIWERDIAQVYPNIDEVHGTHPRRDVVASAQSLLKDTSLKNVIFSQDTLTLEGKSSDTFDFVSVQFLSPFISPIDWLEHLHACYRVLRPGGFLLWREAGQLQTLNPACVQWHDLLTLALDKAGNAFDMTVIMEAFVEETGFKEIQTCHLPLDLSVGTAPYNALVVHIPTLLEAVRPFLLEMQVITDNALCQLSQEVEKECRLQTFSAIWHITTVVAIKSEHS